MRVLIVDGDELSRSHLKKHLLNDGYEVETCATALESLEFFKTTSFPSIVFLDAKLPGRAAYEACEKIRKVKNFFNPYIFLMVDKNHREDVLTGFRSGMNDFISHPIQIEEIRTRLSIAKQILGLSQAISLGSHDCNNALSVILYHVDVLRETAVEGQLVDFASLNKSLEVIHRNGLRASEAMKKMREVFQTDSDLSSSDEDQEKAS